MPKLLIGNVDNEHMVGEPWRFSYDMRCTSSIVANRLLWMAEPGDAIVLPYRVSEEFLDYALGTMNVARADVSVVVVPGGESETQILTHEVLSDPRVVGRLTELTRSAPGSWETLAYYHDRTVAWLSDQLGIGRRSRATDFLRQGGAELLNSKVAFRRIAAGRQVPILDGAVCSSPAALAAAVHEFLGPQRPVIVKQDMNAGGDGNVVIVCGDEDVASLGATDVIRVARAADVPNTAAALWERLTGPRNRELVVEEYLAGSRSYYTEFDVSAGRPALRNFGEMRMEPVWVGFEIPCPDLAASEIGELAAQSMALAEAAASLGYGGRINVDAIRTATGRVLFNEVNGRLGGCTHVDHVARRLLGDTYAADHVLLTRNKVHSGPFAQVRSMLVDKGLQLDPGGDAGVLILVEDTERTGTVEYLVVARDRAAALDLERDLLDLLRWSAQR